MTDKNFLPPEDRPLADQFEALANRLAPRADFERELEKRLMQSQTPEPKKGFFTRAAPALGWALGLALLALILNMAIRSLGPQPAAGNSKTPKPVIAPNETLPAPKPAGEEFNRYGQTMYMLAALPASPAEAFVYNYLPEQRATLEGARALAAQFGLNGAAYQTASILPNQNDFLIVDGNQWLSARSDQYFEFFPDFPRYTSAINGGSLPPSTDAIDEFLQSHGFGFDYEILPSEMYGGFLAASLTPDGRIICYEYFKCAGLRFAFDGDDILSVSGDLPKYEPIGQYGIISAEEAFQLLLHPENISYDLGATGTLEGMHAYSPPLQTWLRPRPVDQTVTLFGWMKSVPSAEGGAPLVTLDGFTVTGNVADVAPSMENTFVEAVGQFREKDGAQTFALESWRICERCEEGLLGSISQQGDRVILNTLDGETLVLPDATALPLPLDNAYIIGARVGETFEWKSIDLRNMSGGGGGGGGGGFGFFKLNLTGVPVPFPTPKPTTALGSGEPFAYTVVAGDTCQGIASAFKISAKDLIVANNLPANCSTLTIGQTLNIPAPASLSTEKVEGLRGTMNVTIYKQADGSQRADYGFMGATDPYPYFLLQGENLEELQAYQNRPVDVWGTVEYKEAGAILTVEHYEIPFPDLQFQILRGTQSLTTLEGQPAALFSADTGQTYVQFYPGGGVDGTLMSEPGDAMLIEALLIPGETFGGYPVARVYGASMAVNPKSGEAAELQISANQVYVIDEAEQPEFVPPTLTIERVMLVYYMPDPIYIQGELQPDQRYIQPAWLFIGHYNDGSEFFFLVQALQRPFLLPEPAPLTQPG